MTYDRLDQILRAGAEPVTARVQQPSTRKLLDDILRDDAPPVAVPTGMTGPRRRWLRPAFAGAALSLLATAVLTLHGADADRAYASWTPDPSPLPAAEARQIVDTCIPAPDAATARVVIGERRGDYAFVNVLTAEGSVTCFRDHDDRVRDTSILAAPVDAARLGAKGIELYAWPQLRTDEGYARLMAGRLGSRVATVEITVRNKDGNVGRQVRATVTDGFFAAWYPEGLVEAGTNSTSLTLRLNDGTTIEGLTARSLMEAPKLDVLTD